MLCCLMHPQTNPPKAKISGMDDIKRSSTFLRWSGFLLFFSFSVLDKSDYSAGRRMKRQLILSHISSCRPLRRPLRLIRWPAGRPSVISIPTIPSDIQPPAAILPIQPPMNGRRFTRKQPAHHPLWTFAFQIYDTAPRHARPSATGAVAFPLLRPL